MLSFRCKVLNAGGSISQVVYETQLNAFALNNIIGRVDQKVGSLTSLIITTGTFNVIVVLLRHALNQSPFILWLLVTLFSFVIRQKSQYYFSIDESNLLLAFCMYFKAIVFAYKVLRYKIWHHSEGYYQTRRRA